MRFLVLVGAAVMAMTFVVVAQEPVFHSSAQLVTVTVSIMDTNGRPVPDIKREDLVVLDDGRPREIKSFDQSLDLPLTLGLIADNSGSQHAFLDQHRDHLRRFLKEVLQKGDRAFLVAVPGPSVLMQDITDSVKNLTRGLDRLDSPLKMMELRRESYFGGACPHSMNRLPTGPNCGSLIWDGVWASAGLKLQKIKGRKAILLLSDGQDTGSTHSLSDTIDAAQAADAPVYSIGSDFGLMHSGRPESGISELKRLSEKTGGAYFDAIEDPTKVFAQIETELRHLYVLSFAIPSEDRDGKFHNLVVTPSRATVRARVRNGYVAQ